MKSMFNFSCAGPFLPVLGGIFLGFTLNMMLSPFLDEMCDPGDYTQAKVNIRQSESVDVDQIDKGKSPQTSTSPLANSPEVQQNVMDDSKKLVRPRFASTELGIREKLFVAVLTSSSSFNSYALAVNKTGAHYVTKMMFFTTAKPNNPSPGMPFVSFPDKDNKNLPIHVLKYLSEHYALSFDYYMFITDRTYIRAEKIYELVSHISISQDIHMGSPDMEGSDVNTCTLEGGVILSQESAMNLGTYMNESLNKIENEIACKVIMSVMQHVIAELDWCQGHTHDKHSATFGSCVYHASLIPCTTEGGDKEFRFYQLNDFDYDDDIEMLRNDPKFNASLSVYPMPDDLSHYKVHRYFCQLELNLTRQEIDKAKESIVHLSQYTSEGRDSLTWPIGSQEVTRPKTRFDVIRWDYFTETHIYFDDDFTNIKPLKGADKMDMQEILETAFTKANRLYHHIYTSYKLLNGYRRFEPSRGVEYVVDLELKDRKGTVTVKRFHLLRPLGKVEIVPMPYVTETTKVNLILPVFASEVEEFGRFFREFEVSVLQTSDESLLYVLFITVGADAADSFSVAKTSMEYYAKQNKGSGAKMAMKVWQTQTVPTEIEILDHCLQDFKSDALIAMVTPWVQMEADFLNRVRLNTISGNQVFFPITFWQYKTNLAYDEGEIPSTVELNGKYGHFDVSSYQHFSFYAGDYRNARKVIPAQEMSKLYVFDVFLKYRKLHIFRAAEPSLRHRWKNVTCDSVSQDHLSVCRDRRDQSLASRAQLAKLVFEHDERSETEAGKPKETNRGQDILEGENEDFHQKSIFRDGAEEEDEDDDEDDL